MRKVQTILGLAAAAALTALPAYADAKAKPPTAPHVQAPKTTGKPTTAGKPTTSGKATSSKPTTSNTSTTTGSNTSSTTTTPALNPIAAKITSKPQLNAKITGMLPGGISLNRASNGFKNQGQFIAALHAAQNLGCVTVTCFMKFKSDMVQNGKWNGPYIKGTLPNDPWGHPYIYKSPGDHSPDYDVFSAGADGQPGTADDIGNWNLQR